MFSAKRSVDVVFFRKLQTTKSLESFPFWKTFFMKKVQLFGKLFRIVKK